MKLFFLICSACTMLFSAAEQDAHFAVIGAVIYLMVGSFDLIYLYKAAKVIQQGKDPLLKITRLPRIEQWIEWAILLTGLALVICDRDVKTAWGLAGAIIWFGAIFLWFVSGVVIKTVGGVPLSMGPGGWAVRYDRNGRLRR